MDNFFQKTPTAKEYRERASVECNRSKKVLTTIFIIYLLIMLAVQIVNGVTGTTTEVNGVEQKSTWFASLFDFFVVAAFGFSFAEISRKVHYEEELKNSDLFSGFKKYGRAFLLDLLQSIFVFLWSLLLIIPGIIKAFAYSMSVFVANENPELTLRECLKKSEKMMVGHKWEYFCLMFSYIGWILLSCLTLGILFIWVLPKMNQASYLFYLKVSGIGEQNSQE
jgi:uncharacterized membrane protein